MTKLIRIFSLFFILCCTSCFSKENYVPYGTKCIYYEIGYDSNNKVYLTDTRSNVQIAFICEGAQYSLYSKEDLLKHFNVVENDVYKETGDYLLKIDIDRWINEAESNEEIYSKHFKSRITRYNISYKKVYGDFHM